MNKYYDGYGLIWDGKFTKPVKKMYTKEQVEFRFMGIKGDLKKKIKKIENVTCLNEDEESVKKFLSKLDVFLFFPDWRREEPWSRAVAEGIVVGCPVIALDRGGTKDQVLKHNNGFLCKRYNDYFKHVIYFLEHKEMIEIMSKNSIRIAQDFYTERVIGKLVKIIGG